jgi:hypothetical protein
MVRDEPVIDRPPKSKMDRYDPYLKGTTYKIYLHLVKIGKPEGISEVQKSLGLSSPSVAQYHIGKLLKMGLVREEQQGYVVDRLVLENIIRIRRRAIPYRRLTWLSSVLLWFF